VPKGQLPLVLKDSIVARTHSTWAGFFSKKDPTNMGGGGKRSKEVRRTLNKKVGWGYGSSLSGGRLLKETYQNSKNEIPPDFREKYH